METRTLQTIDHAMSIALTLTKSWFRGSPEVYGTLVPSIFRGMYTNEHYLAFRPDIEVDTIETFKRHAAGIDEISLPSEDDRFGWLCVMQHYRSPTRILDWTERLLVALYFAVCSRDDVNGELWAMFPQELNKQAGAGNGFPLIQRSPQLNFLVRQPYWIGPEDKLLEEVKLTVPVKSPIAVQPSMLFPRMAVQSSVFTIHPFPTRDTAPIQDVLTDPTDLVRY